MCGIVAYLAYHPAAPAVDRAAVARVAEALRPRGPDGEGAWFADDGRVALAHTRLAIIAPGPEAAQPMHARRGTGNRSCVLSYNGEIYNHAELRLELEARGHALRGGGDTEVLLAMYLEHGEAMLERLRGMFAFALWDAERAELVLARDAYGIKPLYYSDDGWTLRAASQVKALVRDPAIAPSRDPAGWAGYYLLGSVPEPFTVHREVRALPAGSVMRVGEAGPSLPRRWFSLPNTLAAPPALAGKAAHAAPGAAADRALIESLGDALRDSVAAHFVSDVPVGLFLSAGLDSGVLLALARELGLRPHALTLGFDEFRGQHRDEEAGARALASHYGAPHTVRRVSAAEFAEDLPRLLAAMDQPSIDGVNTWFVSKAAAELGLKVALSGVGGDELLAGYPAFRQVPWMVRLGALPARLPLLGEAFRRAATPLLRAAGLHPKYAGLLSLGGRYADAWLLRRGLYMPWELGQVMAPGEAHEGLQRLAVQGLLGQLLAPDPGTPMGRVMALEAGAYLRNQLLRDADWAGMAHGVEIRTPLVDRELLSSLAAWLVRRPASAGKSVLLEVPARRLPRSVAGRGKSGFTVPMEAWGRSVRRDPMPGLPAHVAAIRGWARQVAEAS